MKKILSLILMTLCVAFLACQKKSEKTEEEGMGDTSSLKVIEAPKLNSIPQIPQTLPTTIPSTLPASLPAKAESLPSMLPASQPATW